MPSLLFIMTPGMNLSNWKDNGSFEREIRPYISYADAGWTVTILGFGAEKYDFSQLHKNICCLNIAWSKIQSFLVPFYVARLCKGFDIVKTNQSYCAWLLVFAAKISHKPIVLRCGYVYGEYLEYVGGNRIKSYIYKLFEGWAFRNATYAIVPTPTLANWVLQNYRIPKNRLRINPNFVDADIFKPIGCEKTTRSVITVGRLSPVKRFDLLIRACAKLTDCKLTIIGEGAERSALSALAKNLGVPLEMPGNIPNNNLPVLLCQHTVFALVSQWEGHPKVLIEAMACGLPCVGSFFGQESFDGSILSVSATESDISGAIRELFDDRGKLERYSKGAREFAVVNYGFRKVFNAEKTLLELLV